MDNFDTYYKKNISYNYKGHRLVFRVSQVLFSSKTVDAGTNHFLRSLESENLDGCKILDLGCGYGPIGISLKKANPSSVVHMVDRDALAVEYSRQNSRINAVEDIKVYGSVGYDQVVEEDFGLIVSNIPAKAGESALAYILSEAKYYLCPQGKVAIVAISAIADYVDRVISGLGVNTIFKKQWPGYTVFHYQFPNNETKLNKPAISSFERGIYDREEKKITVNGIGTSIKTVYSLPEFNTLSFETETTLSVLERYKNQHFARAIIFNPNQGIVPVFLSRIAHTDNIALIGRDLLALEASRRNLVINGFSENNISLYHNIDMNESSLAGSELTIVGLNEKDSPEINALLLREAALYTKPKGQIIFVGESTPITRLEKLIASEGNLKTKDRKKYKGSSTLLIEKN